MRQDLSHSHGVDYRSAGNSQFQKAFEDFFQLIGLVAYVNEEVHTCVKDKASATKGISQVRPSDYRNIATCLRRPKAFRYAVRI